MSAKSFVPYFEVQLGEGSVGDYWNWDSLIAALLSKRNSHSVRSWLSQRWQVSVRVLRSRNTMVFSTEKGFRIPGREDSSVYRKLVVSYVLSGNDVANFELTGK